MADPYTLLQNRWYNGLTPPLCLSRSTFQIAQPWTMLPAVDDGLWPAENVIPPLSLTFNPSLCGSHTFFGDYAPVINQLQFPTSVFEADIGESVCHSWTAYLQTITPPPALNHLPGLFRRWALINAPSVASIGTADLTSMVLIATAQQALTPYLGPDALPAGYTGTFDQLQQMLASSPGGSVSFVSTDTDGKVTDTWPCGADSCFWGLWTGASPSLPLSRKFAAHAVTVQLDLGACTVWPSVPGAWYNSSLLNLAYSNQASPPWPSDPNPSWDEMFGLDGSMLRAVASLVVADGLSAVVTSSATYSATDQQSILDHAAFGLWPFFLPAGEAALTEVTFDDSSMVITTVIPPQNPFIIGENVLGIAQYLGHV